jgi:hypothetical protein
MRTFHVNAAVPGHQATYEQESLNRKGTEGITIPRGAAESKLSVLGFAVRTGGFEMAIFERVRVGFR